MAVKGKRFDSVGVAVSGVAGVGKTYREVEVCLQFFEESEGCWYSNLPLFPDKIEEYTGIECAERIIRFPEEVCKGWERANAGESARPRLSRVSDAEWAEVRAGEWEGADWLTEEKRETIELWAAGGPWGYFAARNIDGAHIVFDEAHRFIGEGAPAWLKREWGVWQGELRHAGAQAEYLTQDTGKLARQVIRECGVQVVLSSSADRLVPFVKIPLGDVYQLRGLLTGRYEPAVWVQLERKVGRRFVVEDSHKLRLAPEIFALYDSYSRDAGEAAGSKRYEFQRGVVHTLLWFARRNGARVLGAMTIVAAASWLFFGGGIPWGIQKFSGMIRAKAVQGQQKTEAAMAAGNAGAAASSSKPASIENEKPATVVQLGAAAGMYRDGLRGIPEIDESAALGDLRSWDRGKMAYVSSIPLYPTGRAGDVVYMDKSMVGFRDGSTAVEGQVIPVGVWGGHRVMLINLRGRTVTLSGGIDLMVRGDVVGIEPRGVGDRPGAAAGLAAAGSGTVSGVKTAAAVVQ